MNRFDLLFYLHVISAISYVSCLESENIVGGNEAKEGQFSYQIFIEVYNQLLCGGAIISKNFVLTAAHCVIDDATNKFFPYPFIVIGNTLSTTIKPFNVTVDAVYVPKNYDPIKHLNDISLLKLKTSLDLKKNKLKVIKLPSANQTYAGVKAVVSGYGWSKIKFDYDDKVHKNVEVGSTDGKLKFAVVNVLANILCQLINYPQIIYDTKICGMIIQRSKNNEYEGVCSGDSGGPLVYKNSVIGIVSRSPDGCDERRKAATYTRVSSYLSFIKVVMNGNINTDIRKHKVL